MKAALNGSALSCIQYDVNCDGKPIRRKMGSWCVHEGEEAMAIQPDIFGEGARSERAKVDLGRAGDTGEQEMKKFV